MRTAEVFEAFFGSLILLCSKRGYDKVAYVVWMCLLFFFDREISHGNAQIRGEEYRVAWLLECT